MLPRVRSARLAGRDPSPPTPARLRPSSARRPQLPAPTRCPCRAAAAAVEGLGEGFAHQAAEPPAAALSPTATACIVADVVVELGPEARSGSRPSIKKRAPQPHASIRPCTLTIYPASYRWEGGSSLDGVSSLLDRRVDGVLDRPPQQGGRPLRGRPGLTLNPNPIP